MSTSNLVSSQGFEPKNSPGFGANILSNVPMAWKMGLILLILSIVMLWTVGMAHTGLNKMLGHVDNIYGYMLVPIISISSADSAMADNRFELQKMITEGVTPSQRAQSLATIEKNEQSIREMISQYDREWLTSKSPEFTGMLRSAGRLDLQEQEVETFDQFKTLFGEYEAARQSFTASGQTDNQLAQVTIEKLQLARASLLTLIDINNKFAEVSDTVASREYAQTVTNSSLILIIGLILGLVLSYLVIRSVNARLNGLTRNAYALQEGDFNQKVVITGRDEIGRLGSIFTKMGTQLKDLFDAQEQRVAERTHDLELASEVGRAMTEKVSNLSELLSQAVELIRSRFDLYYTQIYMLDSSGHTLRLQAGTGHVGQELLRRRHHLDIASGSLNGRAALDRRAVIVVDTLNSPNFLPNPLLPLTRSEMSVPLIANNKVLGVLDMQSERPDTFRETNLSAFEVLAGQLAIAIQNAALFQQAEESRLEVEAQANRLTAAGWQEFLNAVDRRETIGYSYSQNEVVPIEDVPNFVSENVLAIPIEISGANIGEIRLADQSNRQWTQTETQIVRATVVRVAQHVENLRLLAQAERYRAEAEAVSRRLTSEGWNEYLKTRHDLASGYIYDHNEVQPFNGNGHTITIPAISHALIVHDETIGELIVNADSKEGQHAIDIVTAVAQQLSDHIENLRLLEQAQQRRLQADGLTHELAQRAGQLETVATLSTTTSTVLDPDQLLQDVVDLTKERFGLYHVQIYLADPAVQTLFLASGAGEVGRQMVSEQHTIWIADEGAHAARAVREQRAIIINDVQNQPGFLPNPLLPETWSEIAIPMIAGDTVIGVFDAHSSNPEGFSKEDASIYTTLAAQVAVALQNARLYAEQAATVTQLRELDRLKSSFLASMSHELRTPLNSILGFADVMLEGLDGELTENMNIDLGLIRKNGQHLLNLINDVLDMAKIESGSMSLHPETVMVHEILDEVTSITSSLASEKNIALFLRDDSDQEVEIYADRTRLRQVMINLVNNSIKFTEAGKIALHAKRIEDNKVLITVKDTGIGIPTDKLETIFQEFTQVDNSSTRKVGGTGLGLPISRKLVEMHGGRLWAESTGIPGEGSTFYVELPLQANIVEVN